MIIKDNDNKKDVNPLTDYTEVGKGSHSLEKELELEKNRIIKEKVENKVLEDLRDYSDDEDDEDDDDNTEDNWKFFR